MPVGEMLTRMDSRELSEWRAFFELRRDGVKPKSSPSEKLKAMFVNRVKRKEA